MDEAAAEEAVGAAPFTVRRSAANPEEWGVLAFGGGAIHARGGGFDHGSEALAEARADSLNRQYREWVVGRALRSVLASIDDRMASWQRAADEYRASQPEMAADMYAEVARFAALRGEIT